MSDRFDEVKDGDVQNPNKNIDEVDNATAEAKLEILKAESSVKGSWYDTKCDVCGRRCCSPCTADGDPSRCAKTRFRNCSVCGHASSSHYRVRH